MKTSTKRKAISKKEVIDFPEMATQVGPEWGDEADAQSTVEQVKDWSRFKPQGEVECIRYQGGKELCFCDDCILDEEPKMSLANKITLVLTVVNVAILGYLIVKNS